MELGLDIDKIKDKAEKSDVEVYSEEYLDKCIEEARIIPGKKYRTAEFVVKLVQDKKNGGRQEIPLLSKGNISGIIGGAKAKKTFFMSILMSIMFKQDNEFAFLGNLYGKKVLFLDTEQSFYHVQRIQERIKRMNGGYDLIDMVALREYPEKELRLAIAHRLISSGEYSFIINDGIVDYINDYNSLAESGLLIGKMMAWSSKYDCHIANVLHTNKDKVSARGHIGNELINKAETVIRITKSDVDSSEVSCDASRNVGFDSFSFYVDDKGLPRRSEIPMSWTGCETEGGDSDDIYQDDNNEDLPF